MNEVIVIFVLIVVVPIHPFFYTRNHARRWKQ